MAVVPLRMDRTASHGGDVAVVDDGKQFSFDAALPCGALVVSSGNASSPPDSYHAVYDNVVVVVVVVVLPRLDSHLSPFVVDLPPFFLASYCNDIVPSRMVTYQGASPCHDRDPAVAFVSWPSFAVRGTSDIVRTPPCSPVYPWGMADTCPCCSPCVAFACHPIRRMRSVEDTLMWGNAPCDHSELCPHQAVMMVLIVGWRCVQV